MIEGELERYEYLLDAIRVAKQFTSTSGGDYFGKIKES
jgi:hypothetical protein